ncbi:MAG: 50S ribosomal protein L18 [Christensenellales bacterium]|jgi:large subunit ribosomal protein L18
MITKQDKNVNRKIRHFRVRNNVYGTAERPRLNVFRSLNEIYAQIIDDTKGVTLVSASTKEKALQESLKGLNKTAQAKLIGEAVAKKALEKNITAVVFDRGGYLYTGRVAALAEGARSQGLKF